MARLDRKIALITGAGSGIGRATARAMAVNGAKVVVAELNAAAGEQTAHIISEGGGHCIAVPTDVSQEDSVRAAVETVVRHYADCTSTTMRVDRPLRIRRSLRRQSKNSGVRSAWTCLARSSDVGSGYRRSSHRAVDR